jgi:sulfopyruvate decarboxylase TPP-binding subunit
MHFFTAFATSREEEAVGIVAGAWMGGTRGAVLMQTSGFATLANVLASMAVPCQIPLIMVISERGTLGEFNVGQALVCRTMRPVLQALALDHHTIARVDELEFIADVARGSASPSAIPPRSASGSCAASAYACLDQPRGRPCTRVPARPAIR